MKEGSKGRERGMAVGRGRRRNNAWGRTEKEEEERYEGKGRKEVLIWER